MRTRTTLAALTSLGLLAIVAMPAQAATYSAGLDFAADDQSMWQQGSAGILDIDRFIGPTWSESGTVGGIFEAEVPAQTIIPEVCAWGVCTPAVTTPAIDFGDFGAKISGSTSGAIGFDLDFSVNTGAVDVAFPGIANFEWPDPDQLVPGAGTLAIQTGFAEGATSLDTVFPFAELELDFVFDVFLGGGVQVCVVSCGSLNFPSIDIDERIELIDIDSGTVGTTFDLGFVTIGAQLPDSDMNASDTGTNAAGNLVANAADPADALFDLDIDLDLIATTLLGLPALTQDFSFLGASAGFTLLDVLVGAEVRLIQQFTFNPDLEVRLAASDGQVRQGDLGSALLFNTFTGGETLVTPTFLLNNNFRNVTSLVISPTFDFRLLSAHLGLDLPSIANTLGIDDVNLAFGPLFQTHQSIDFTVPIFDQSWEIPFAPIVGQSFIVKVPEPGALSLLGLGLALIGVFGGPARRRRLRG